MAPLKVIGAGVSRTGTDSLRIALNMLGYNTHHGRLMVESDGHPELFSEAFEHPEKEADWDLVYEGYDAAVETDSDQTDADSWYESVLNTIYKFYEMSTKNPGEYTARIRNMVETVFLNGSFKDMQKFKDDPETMKARYKAHNDWVMKIVPPERLLVLDLRDGITWDRICPFLGKPIPDVPYPHINTPKSLHEEFPELLKKLSR